MAATQLKIITTEDGSHSLFREDLNETYHSLHGAKGESLHVFIQHGLKYVLEKFPHRKNIHVFEVGFGTGLNAFLASLFAQEHAISVHFHSVEPMPVPKEIFSKLNFGTTQKEETLLQQIHETAWEEAVVVNDYFKLSKYKVSLENFQPKESSSYPSDGFDALFFDAFAPSKQSEIWSPDNLKKCYKLLRKGGILTTYCAQGQFKRNLAAVGFEVETLPGAPGKKEMVRGVKA